MTAKEKAKELVSKMAMHQVWHSSDNNVKGMQDRAKECALVAVDEILSVIGDKIFSEYNFWQQVKTEIEKP